MSDKEKQSLQPEAVPFFARFLEGQGSEELSEEEMQGIAGGKKKDVTTQKYPSDSDEGGDVIVTQKFPSDSDEGGDVMVTQKYPSDGDDSVSLLE